MPSPPPASDDPLTIAVQPPPDESPAQRQEREKNETAAEVRSGRIDEYLKLSGKKAKVTKLLLLGLSALFIFCYSTADFMSFIRSK
jgi:guanine nucleotide-binding protein alpha-1 subunit